MLVVEMKWSVIKNSFWLDKLDTVFCCITQMCIYPAYYLLLTTLESLSERKFCKERKEVSSPSTSRCLVRASSPKNTLFSLFRNST